MSSAIMEVTSAAYRPAEHHAFQTAGKDFLYLVPSGAVFGLSGLAKDIFGLLLKEQLPREELVSATVARGYDRAEVAATRVRKSVRGRRRQTRRAGLDRRSAF